jgi:hypothetical protein
MSADGYESTVLPTRLATVIKVEPITNKIPIIKLAKTRLVIWPQISQEWAKNKPEMKFLVKDEK